MMFWNSCNKNFINYPAKRVQLGFLLMKLHDYSLWHITILNTRRDFSGSAEKEKNVLKFRKFPKNFSKTVPFSLTLQSRISDFNKKRLQEKVFESFLSYLISVSRLQSRIYTLPKKSPYRFFRGCLEKTVVLKVSGNFRKNLFFGVSFKQFELSNLPPIAILETDSVANVSWEWLQFLGRTVNILIKDSTVDVYLKATKTFRSSYFFLKH